MNTMHQFLFGIFPYICLAVFLLGSLVRFDRDQYTWKSDSSQLLRRGQLRWGSNLFHIYRSDLGIGIGHGENNGLVRHVQNHLLGHRSLDG